MASRQYESHGCANWRKSGLVRPDIFLNCHVPEFAGFKDIATFLTLDKFSVVIASHDTYARMPAHFLHNRFFGGLIRER